MSASTSADERELQGEGVVPGSGAASAYHRWIRYHVARRFAPGKRVLDLAAGECEGAVTLARVAAEVTAVDPSERAIRRAGQVHATVGNLALRWARIEDFLEAADAARWDVVTAFELLEHLDEAAQRKLVARVRRVLAPGGALLVSVAHRARPDAADGADAPAQRRALDARELELLLRSAFSSVEILRQVACAGAALFAPGATSAEVAAGAWDANGLPVEEPGAGGLALDGEHLLAIACDAAPPPERLQPVIVVDAARQLVAEEVEAARRALDLARGRERLQAVDREEDVAELRRRLAAMEDIAERLALSAARVQDDVTRLQRVEARLRDTEHALFHLRRMLGVRVVLRAKAALDRAPRLQRIVKAVRARLR